MPVRFLRLLACTSLARPACDEGALARSYVTGHVSARDPYSSGHWLREAARCLAGNRQRRLSWAVTGLYFAALTRDWWVTPDARRVRKIGDTMTRAA